MKQTLIMDKNEILDACRMWLEEHHPERVTPEPLYLHAERAYSGDKASCTYGSEWLAITVNQQSEIVFDDAPEPPEGQEE